MKMLQVVLWIALSLAVDTHPKPGLGASNFREGALCNTFQERDKIVPFFTPG